MEGSMMEVNRGKLFFDEKGVGMYRFVKGEPHTCSNCKEELVYVGVYACEFCKNVYCFDCVKGHKACSCFTHYPESFFHKVIVGNDL